MRAEIAALVFARGHWREGDITDRLDKVRASALDRAGHAYEKDYIDEQTEVAVAKAAEKMCNALKDRA